MFIVPLALSFNDDLLGNSGLIDLWDDADPCLGQFEMSENTSDPLCLACHATGSPSHHSFLTQK